MDTLDRLADALATAQDIRSIVRTMKSVSSVNIHQFERAEESLAEFARVVDLGLTAALRDQRARGCGPAGTIMRHAGRAGLIVIGSERGLCGRYNETITRFAEARIGADSAALAVIGARAAARLKTRGHSPDALFALPGSVDGLTQIVQSIVLEIDSWAHARGITRITLVHNRREGRITAIPVETQLLPLPQTELQRLASADWPANGLPAVRMDPDALLAWLIQQRLFVMLYHALTQALSSEHATRLAAMQRAERNIEERQTELKTAYRQTRQASITRELMDVIAGFQAVGGAD